MVIKSLTLKNFRRFRSLDVQFPENLIGVIGPNGSGKTTLLEAIGWVLYGNRVVRTDKSEVRSQFADSKDACSAEMVFEIGGHDYRIKRELRGKNAITEAAIHRAGEPSATAERDSGVNEFVETLLGLDYQSFFASVFAKQRDLAALSEMRPEERRKAINRLINIERIDQTRNRVRQDRIEKEAFLQGKQSGLKDLDAIQHQVQEKQKELSSLQKSEEAADKKVEQLTTERKNRQKKFDEISDVRDKYFEYQRRIDQFNERILNQKREKSNLSEEIQKIHKAEKKLEELKPAVSNWELLKSEKENWDSLELKFHRWQNKKELEKRLLSEIDKQNKQVEDWEKHIAEMTKNRQSFGDVQEKLSAAERKQEALQEKLTQVQGDIQALNQQINEIQKHEQSVKKLGKNSPCPICQRPLEEHYDIVMQDFEEKLTFYQKSKKEKSEVVQQLKKELKNIKEKLADLRKQDQQNNTNLSRISVLQDNLNSARISLEEKSSELRDVQKQINEFGQFNYDPEKHQEIKTKYEVTSEKREKFLQLKTQVERLPELQRMLTIVEESISNTAKTLMQEQDNQKVLNFDEQEFLAKKTAVNEIDENLSNARSELGELQRNLAVLQQTLKQKQAELTEQQKLREQIKLTQNEIVYLKLLDEHLGNFRMELSGRIRPLIANRASELLALTTNNRYSIMELDTDYNIYIFDGTERFGIGRFSGGEQDLANLCLRIAISQVVAERSGGNPLNFIVLDEIFGSQDQERKFNILNALNQLSSQFRQIFLVTHIEDIKDSLPVLIQVNQDDELKSHVQMI